MVISNADHIDRSFEMINKKQILIISAVFPPEPVVSARISCDIAEELSSLGHAVVVLSPVPTRPLGILFPKENATPLNYEHITLPSYTCPGAHVLGRIRESLSFGWAISNYIAAHKESIGVIYANSWPLFSQALIIKSAQRYHIPVIMHIQDVYPESLVHKLPNKIGKIIYHTFLPLDKYILRYSDTVIGISPRMISYLSSSRKINKDKFRMIRNWQDDRMWQKTGDNPQTQDVFTFMFLGNLADSTNLVWLIESFHKLSVPNARLIIAGDGSCKEKCREKAQELNESRISFMNVDPSQVPEIQSRADVLLLPLKEGIARTATPSKLIAYCFSGKPIIASLDLDSDTADIIQSAECGYVTSPNSTEELLYAMKTACESTTEQRQLMGRNARNYADKHLSRAVNLNSLVSLIVQYAN